MWERHFKPRILAWSQPADAADRDGDVPPRADPVVARPACRSRCAELTGMAPRATIWTALDRGRARLPGGSIRVSGSGGDRSRSGTFEGHGRLGGGGRLFVRSMARSGRGLSVPRAGTAARVGGGGVWRHRGTPGFWCHQTGTVALAQVPDPGPRRETRSALRPASRALMAGASRRGAVRGPRSRRGRACRPPSGPLLWRRAWCPSAARARRRPSGALRCAVRPVGGPGRCR